MPDTLQTPKFYFKVEWDKKEMFFQEVSGLDMQSEAIAYRHGDSPRFAAIKMPGIGKLGNVTVKRVYSRVTTSFGIG